MIIELLNSNDNSLEELLKEAFHKDVEKINIEECLKNNIRFICAKIDNIVVGTIMITTKYNPVRNTNSFYLDYVCTKEEYRNMGIATKLLNEIDNLAKKEKIAKIELDTSYDRENAIKLYEKLEYVKRSAYIYSKEVNLNENI